MIKLLELVKNILLSDSIHSFLKNLQIYFEYYKIKKFIIWEVENNLATPLYSSVEEELYLCDILDLGFNEIECSDSVSPIPLSDNLMIYKPLFLIYKNSILLAISICEKTSYSCKDFYEISDLLAQKYYDLKANESRLQIFTEYQKKIDFIKKASEILRDLEIENIITRSLSFFMEIFESEAGVAKQNDNYYTIGFSEEDMEKSIFINETPLIDYLKAIERTEYIDIGITSNKFIINNLFIIYEPKIDLKVAIFNLKSNFYPDKEFSEIISHITSIAVENAINHKKEVMLKIEETEMKTTADILNRFVNKEISFSNQIVEIFGVNYPAKQTSGDFLNLFHKGDRLVMVLADVCGKGYSAAVITVALSTMFDQLKDADVVSPATFAKRLTDFLLNKRLDGRFVTLFMAEISLNEHTMKYISLGHEPVYLKIDNKLQSLTSEYMPSGIISEDYKDTQINIPPQCSIFVYSDGLIEYIDYNTLEDRLITSTDKPEIFITSLYNKLVIDKNNQMDDFTCLKIEFKG
ncbi:MAG: SpoIIE family protein phosphatase [Deferribacterales bacterium]